MKKSLTIFVVLALSSCKSNFLTRKYLPNYSEFNTFENYPYIKINQELYFDQKRWVDEEHTRVLNLELKIPVDSVINKTIDINLDSNIINYRYGIRSVWRYHLSKDELTGTIQITKANEKVLVVEEDLFDAENKLKIKGKRKITMANND